MPEPPLELTQQQPTSPAKMSMFVLSRLYIMYSLMFYVRKSSRKSTSGLTSLYNNSSVQISEPEASSYCIQDHTDKSKN